MLKPRNHLREWLELLALAFFLPFVFGWALKGLFHGLAISVLAVSYTAASLLVETFRHWRRGRRK